MGQFINDSYEAILNVDQPIDQVWSRLQESADGEPAWLGCWPRMPSFDAVGKIVELQSERLIRVHKTSEPCRGSEIAITLSPAAAGTRLTVTQSNLPEWVSSAVDIFVLGGNQITADLSLFLHRGIQLNRHALPWAFAGFTVREVSTGLEVSGVMPGSYAERLGLEPGDLLLIFGGAPVFTQLCVQALLRVLEPGAEVEAQWARGDELLTGSARL